MRGSGKSISDYDKSEIKTVHELTIEREGDTRTWFQKDRDKLIHSSAFRRLQGKTQVFGWSSSDFFRTRLTHSIEAAQIAKGIAQDHGVANIDLVEFACLAHDIGHPPFGHAGEQELQKLMKDHGGFEGNAQNFRVLNKLEIKFEKKPGLDLTRTSIDSILKYPKKYSDAVQYDSSHLKFYYDDDDDLVKWAKVGAPEINEQSIECQIMEWADDVAYSTHDLEDGIKSSFISDKKIEFVKDQVKKTLDVDNQWNEKIWEEVKGVVAELSNIKDTYHIRKAKRTEIIAQLIHKFITTTKVEQRTDFKKYASRYRFTLKPDPKMKIKCAMLKQLVRKMILNDERVTTLERKGQLIVHALFKELTNKNFDNNMKLLPQDFQEKMIANHEDHDRVVCDYIAGMTDAYALKLYSRIKESDIHSIFEIL